MTSCGTWSKAGFSDIHVHEESAPQFGIFPPHRYGLPITAVRPGHTALTPARVNQVDF